jgi:hypothetical protein
VLSRLRRPFIDDKKSNDNRSEIRRKGMYAGQSSASGLACSHLVDVISIYAVESTGPNQEDRPEAILYDLQRINSDFHEPLAIPSEASSVYAFHHT